MGIAMVRLTIRRVTFIFWLALICLPCLANAKGPAIFGHGNISCGSLSTQKKSSLKYIVTQSWVLGFINGVRLMERGTWHVDALGSFAWINNYCRDHPLDMVAVAALRLIEELRKRGPK